MSIPVISIENISKEYQLGAISTDTFRGELQRWWAKLRGLPDPHLKIGEKDHGNRDGETVWALKDINLQVQQGEALGIIGRNGAGKSTLLKILSRVTAPTSGVIKTKGKIASLLEVGTGFHPELTGRENIYLNGAILGMTRAEVARKFDEIVDFSGVERFIDTPVKRYSSGMYVRLAFAVAAHLEPEILVVDEVLAVGDIDFQRKCVGKMEQVGSAGRTVLFVSHNMMSIARLCQRVVLLDQGKIVKDGSTSDVIGHYLDTGYGTRAERRWPDLDTAPGDKIVRLTAVCARDDYGNTQETFDIRNPIGVDIEYHVMELGKLLHPQVDIFTQDDVHLFCSIDQFDPVWGTIPRQAGMYKSTCWIPGNFLAEGIILVRVAIIGISVPLVKHVVEAQAIAFQVIDTMEGNSVRGRVTGNYRGVLRPKLDWETKFLPGQVN